MNAKCLITTIVALALGAGVGWADAGGGSDQPNHHAGRKLARGLSNVLFGVVEVPNQVMQTNYRHGGAAAATLGVGKGFGRWLMRMGVGVFEIVTFPVPVPDGYRPLMKPEFPVDDYDP
jgi:putative exosortase-associated protein (TIGR04073 family)